MEPTQYKRVIGLLRGVAYVLRSLLSLVPVLETLLKNWQPGSNPSENGKDLEETGQVNPGKETENE